MKKKYRYLTEAAQSVMQNAYSPFSKFRVGAAILTNDGKIITGCNIENSSFSLTICAERVAIFKAISEGVTKFKAIAVVSDAKDFTPPCGACRQVLVDLAGNIDIVLINSHNQMKIKKLNDLIPLAFTKKKLMKGK